MSTPFEQQYSCFLSPSLFPKKKYDHNAYCHTKVADLDLAKDLPFETSFGFYKQIWVISILKSWREETKAIKII